MIVVAPVLNLSGGDAFDALKVTDMLASELASYPGYSVVPVNLAVAALLEENKQFVESPEDAANLARRFGAEACIVAAVTEYSPYDPPTIGFVAQWYANPDLSPPGETPPAGPLAQVQRVLNAADEDVIDELKEYADERGADDSPYGWRKFVKSQELYVRYSCWSLIGTITRQLHSTAFGRTHEQKS